MVRTLMQTAEKLNSPAIAELPAPAYVGERATPRLGLAVKSMERHMTDEGWQLFQGLASAGYVLYGDRIGGSITDVRDILRCEPGTLVLQDKREYEGLTADRSRDPQMRFYNVDALARRDDVFKLTVLKDSHQQPEYHAESAKEMGAHAWVVYYHPTLVKHLAPYVREQHLVRTYHTVNAELVPAYSAERKGVLLSGAMNKRVYPLRERIRSVPGVTVYPHPGYHRRGCETPQYLKLLSRFKVAVCTSSIYGYALRKIVEATACGCAVLTDLPVDEVLPGIDTNLVRVNPEASLDELTALLHCMRESYDPGFQELMAMAAQQRYDYRIEGLRLADAIERMRRSYK